MTAYKGSLVLIKVGDGDISETFTTIGGLRASSLVMNNQAVSASTVESGPWRVLKTAAGLQSMRLSGTGIFTDSEAEETIRAYAFAASANNYEFHFANGDVVAGPFLITAYQRSGNLDGEELFNLALESAGPVTFTAG